MMTEDDFIAAALTLPEAVEGGHQGNADVRVRKKVFATLDRKKGLGALNLTPEQQEVLMTASSAFFPANGAWGERGWTKITLADADPADVRAGLNMSWAKTAPKTLVKAHQPD